MAIESVPGAGKFTDEILVKNFVAISKEFGSVSNRIDMLDNGVRHVSDHISELYDMVLASGNAIKALQKPKGMKTKHKVILGVAAGIYLGRKTMRDEFNKRLEQVKTEAKEQFDNFVASQKQGDSVDGATPSGS